MQLTSTIIDNFVREYLVDRFDAPVKSADCHVEWWDMCCSPSRQVAIAAPRNHAKSTTITHAYVVASVLFGFRDFVLIVSGTEWQSIQFLGDIKMELMENELLQRDFGPISFLKDSETEIVVQCDSGSFKIVAKGAEQKIRGLKWRNKRPNLIVGDDMEDDEQVMNKDRRLKFSKWVMNALIPSGSTECLIRVVGTVLHMDSFLEGLLNSEVWTSKRFEAHNDDFSVVLWPERWPKEALQKVRAEFVEKGNLEGYNQEFRNMPVSDETAFFKQDWLLKMTDEDRGYFRSRSLRRFVVSTDIAVTPEEYGDFAVFGVFGVDPDQRFHLLHVIRERMDSYSVVETLFNLHDEWKPDLFLTERGVIEKVLGPLLKMEMIKRGKFLHFETVTRTQKKRQEAKAVQRLLRAGGMKFDKETSWWADFEDEIIRFDKVKHDDQVDMLSLIGLMVDRIVASASDDELKDEAYEILTQHEEVRESVTGY